MADIQSNINVNINTSEALASIRTLQRQISAFYESMARSGAAASAAASNMQNNLINTINQTGKFSASIKTIASTTEAFTTSLEKNKLSMGQYFKFAGGASKTFGKFFKTEMDTIDKVARERVKTLQTQYIKLGRDASGALKSIAIRPLTLDMKDLGTQTAIAAQKQQLMNQLLKQGSTNLLNFGKNTQWAGRQLMVGFTIPLAMVGTAAAKTFMKMEEQAIKFKRVYGDSMTPGAETDAMVKQIRELATEFTKYGVAAEKTMELAATAAAAGKQGLELTAQVREANRLAVLGQVEQQEALSTTISITNAFGVAASDLAKKIDFLNAVENQTVTSIEDLTIAVPKAGPVVKQLGGDVEDLAFFLTAMKEGGINASEGANALKSGLAALINPTGKAADMLASFGINVKGIVEANKGDVKGLVVDFAKALDTLDPLSRARAIEQLFGKFQFSRLSTLFQNVIAEGTQASRVLELTGRSASDLAALSSKELGTVAASSMFKFQKAVEELKMALAPIGEIFLKLITPLLEFGSKVLENFNKLDSGAKNFIVGLIGVVGGLGPVLIMTFGLLANGIANIIKGFMLVRNIFTKSGDSSKYLGDQTEYMTQQQLEAAGVAASLEQVHQRLEQRFTSEAIAVDKLTQALQRANNANLTYMGRNTGAAGAKPKKYAKGVVSVPGPKGAGDIVPAMLSPGEAVIPSKQAAKYAALIQGIVADNLPGYEFSNVDTSDANRPSQARRAKSGGGQSLVIRGGADQAHFDTNENMSMTIREIEAMAESMGRELSSAARRMFERLAAESGQGLDTVIRVWSDKVIMLEGELHKLFTSNAGEDKGPVPVSAVKRVLSEQGAGTYAKTRDTLISQGVSESDANEQIGLIEKEVSRRLDALGDEAVITSQEFNGFVESAHKAVGELTRKLGEAESDLERAYATMSEIRTFQGKDSKGKVNRLDIFANEPGYQNTNVTAKTRESANKLSDGNILRNRGMKITQDIEDAVGKSEKEILEAWGRIPSRMQDELASIRSNAKGFADRFQEILKTLGISINTSLQTGLSAIPSQAGANVTLGGVGQGLDEAIQRNSPPKEAIKIGRDYGFALNGALRELIPKVRVAGEAFGVAATTGMTTVTPAMRQHLIDHAGRILRPYLDAQGRLVPIAKQKIEILDREAIAAKKAADAENLRLLAMQRNTNMSLIAAGVPQSLISDGPGNKDNSGNNQDNTPGTDKTNTKLNRFNNSLRTGSFMLTSLAAAGTMSGGVIGEMSTKVMQFSGIIFVASTLMDLLVAAQQRQILAQIAHTKAIEAGTIAAGTQMKTGFLTTLSNFLMFSSGKAKGGKFLTELASKTVPVTGAFAKAGGGLKGFIAVIKNAAINVGKFVSVGLRFIPVIGYIIAAVGAFILITNLVRDAKERERLATEGVSDAMISTTEELNSIAEVLGKQEIKSSVDRIGIGPASEEQIGVIDKLRGSQEFKDRYKADIDAMRTMSQRELQSYQNTLAISLQATNQYTKEEIEGVIKALQLEAGRTDVKLNFAAIDITSKDPAIFQRSLDKFASNAKASQLSSLDETQSQEAENVAIAGYYQTFDSVNTALATGAIGLKDYTTKMDALKKSLTDLGQATETTVVQGMMNSFTEALKKTQPELAEMASKVKGASGQLFVMDALTSGAITDISQLAEVIRALNTLALGEMSVDADTWAAANRVIEGTKKTIAEATKATAAYKDAQETKGSGEKSIFQQATESLYDNVKAIKESTKAYSLLSKAGLSASDAFKIAKDPILAAALATTKVGTAKWKELIDRIQEFLAITKTSGLSQKISELFGENQKLQNMEKLSRYLQQTGLDAEQLQEVLNDPELADQLLYATGEGKKGFDQIKKTVGFIIKNKEIKISLLPITEQFKEKMSKVTEAFNAKKNVLDIQFRIDTRSSQDIVRKAQADINALNFQADDYEAGLTRLEDGEEAINEKYDNRIEALDKVIAANDRIANQNKEELNIFQMVARGDIAGAAAGIAQLQQQKAKDALEAKKESLQAQRTNELESLTAEVVVDGQKVRMTRNQIEENLKNIKQQIFNIEENTLEPAQRQIEKAQEKLDADNASLTVLELTEDEWLKIEANIDLATVSTVAYVKKLQEALDIAKQIPGALDGTSAKGGDIVGQQDPVLETDFGNNAKIKPQPKPGGGGPGMPPPPVTEAEKDEVAANRGSTELIWGKGASYSQVSSYQNDLAKVRRWESGDKSWMSEDNYKESKKKVKDFEMEYGKRDVVTGEFWSSPRLKQTLLDKKLSGTQWGVPYVPPNPFAVGGKVKGPGTGTSDSIPALLSNGEYVIRANAVRALGTDTLDKMNYADKNRFADGGSVGRQEAAMAARGGAKPKSNPIADIAKAIFFAPLDMAKDFNRSIGNVLTGKGDGLDYLSLASALPAGRITSSASKILKSLSTKKAPLGVGVKEISGVEPLLNPNDSLVKSLVTGNLLHGSKAQTAKEFAIKTSGGSKENWFGANFFTTGSEELANSYGAAIYRMQMPLSQAQSLKILDLYPGAKPIEQQFPGLVDIIKSTGVNLSRVEGLKDIALATRSKAGAKFINNPKRHMAIADAIKSSPELKNILTKKFGINAIRHQSGHNVGMEQTFSEVFAFFNPKNIKAKYTGNIEAEEAQIAAEAALVQKWLDQARSARKKAKGGLVRYADGGFVDRQDTAMANRGKKSNPLMDTLKSIFFAPLDMAKEFNNSIGNVLTGKGQGGDFLNVASALPIGKGASLLGKGFGAVKSLIKNRPGSIESMLNRSVIATRMPHDTLLQMLRTGDTKYRTAFETGTGADFITQTGHLAGKPDPYNKRMRHAMEEYAFAIDYKKNTLEQRPTYGLMATVGPINKALNAISGGKYAKRFNELTNPMNTKLDLYGDISLISNKKVPKRSQFYAGDLRNAYYQNDAHFMYRKTQGINFPPMRGASQAEIAGNPSGFLADKVKPLNIGDSVQFAPYIEAYTRGGFDLSEISKILVSNPNILKTLPQELKKSGLDIPVKLYPGIRSKEILFKTLDFLADIEDKVRGKNTLKLNSQDMPKFADGGLVDRRDAAMAARNPNAARDKLFKKGGIQGFEAGIQGMLSDFGKLDPVKNFANFLTDKGNALAFETRKTMAFLSTPVEILGGKAKSFATIASQISKGNIPGAIGTALKSGLGIDTIESIGNAYSGVLDPSKQKATMFEQAGQTVISNKLFGAGNPESDALARVIAGSLNLAGDPLSYLGVGAAAKGIKLSASAATSAAKIGQIGNVVKNVGKAAGYTPGLLGLPNAADVQNIASLLNKGKISGGVGSTAKAEDTSWADFDPFDDSSVVPTTVPTISLGTSSPLDNVFTSEPVRKVVDTDANTSNYEELAMSKVRNLFHPLKNPEGLSYTYKPIDLMFGDPGHIIEAKTPTGESVGKLEWKADTGEIDMVFVDRDFQRKGVATDMWHMANIEALKNPNILHPLHSPELSATGRAWRDSVGGGMLEDTINAKFKFNRENLVNPREEYLKTISNNANIAEKLKTPGKIMDMFGMKGNLSASGLTPDELYTIEEYIARPGRLHFSTFKNVRKTVDDIISKNNLTIPKGSNLVRVTGNRDAAQLAEMKAGDRFTLDQFWSVTSGEDTDFLEGMATASKDTGGRYSLIEMINGKPVAKKFPLIKFNVRSDVPGIWNMNSLLEEPASDVIDGLLARGQSMEIESITTGIDGQKIYNINLGSIAENSSIPELGLNEFSTKKWYEQMRNDPSLDPKYAKDWTEQGFIKEMNKIRMDEMSPIYRAKGGIVAPKYFANGGMVMPKYFAKGGDVVPAMLTPGEFVMTKHAVDNYGVDNLRAINSGAAPGNSVYNGYNINVNVRSNSNPDQIANAVMTQIRQVNAQQVRGSKF